MDPWCVAVHGGVQIKVINEYYYKGHILIVSLIHFNEKLSKRLVQSMTLVTVNDGTLAVSYVGGELFSANVNWWMHF